MSVRDDLERIPIKAAPDWVQRIVDEEMALPEELAEAKARGHSVYRSIVSKRGDFIICFDQETGEAVEIIWVV